MPAIAQSSGIFSSSWWEMRLVFCTSPSVMRPQASRPAGSVALSRPGSTCTVTCRGPISCSKVHLRAKSSTTHSWAGNTCSLSRPVRLILPIYTMTKNLPRNLSETSCLLAIQRVIMKTSVDAISIRTSYTMYIYTFIMHSSFYNYNVGTVSCCRV